jgi:hypothetical protein
MKKIISFNMARLLVKELGTLARNVQNSVKGLLTVKQIPQKLVDDLDAAVVVYNSSVGALTPSELAELAEQYDDERGNIELAIKGVVLSTKYRPEENIRAAGRRLEEAIRHRGWSMQTESYGTETTLIDQLLDDIRGSAQLTSDAATIAITSLVEQLDLCNKRFKENEQKRNAAEVGSITSNDAVRNLQNSIQTIFGYLNSVSGVYPEVASAIDTLNVAIEPLVAQLKTRATIAEKKKEEVMKNINSSK